MGAGPSVSPYEVISNTSAGVAEGVASTGQAELARRSRTWLVPPLVGETQPVSIATRKTSFGAHVFLSVPSGHCSSHPGLSASNLHLSPD